MASISQAPEVSVVIASHNEGIQLFLTVHAVEQSADLPYEIIVVDDGSTDASADFLLDWPAPHRRMIRTPGVGPAIARNIGANAARGNVIIFLDAHCFPSAPWMSPLASGVRRDPDAIYTSCIVAAGRPLQRGWGLTIVSPTFDVCWLSSRPSPGAVVPIAGAACMAVSPHRFFSLGGFYPFKVIGLEDVELSFRQWAHGGTIRMAPDVEVAHIFADRWRRNIRWSSYLLNVIFVAALHLDDDRLSTTLRHLRSWQHFEKSLHRAETLGVWAERARMFSARERDFGSFCEAFGIEWRAAGQVR